MARCIQCNTEYTATTACQCGARASLRDNRQQVSPRFAVVVVSKYIGQYGRNSATAYAIADRQLANSIVSRKFDDRQLAQVEADRLNARSRDYRDDPATTE